MQPTKLAHESKDMDRAIATFVAARPATLEWLVVLYTGRIERACYSLNEARALTPRGAVVKNLYTGRIVHVAT